MNNLEQNAYNSIKTVQGKLTFPHDFPFNTIEIMSFCEIESSFNPYEYRFERKLNDASYGLMQILLKTAQDRGYQGQPEGLYDPEINITYGTLQLIWITQYIRARSSIDNPADFIRFCVGAYNAGVGNVLHGFLPEIYISKWETAREKWRKELS